MASHVLCLLKKGERRKEAWVPEHLAIVGKVLTFKRKNANHDDGWVVKIVGERRQSFKERVPEKEKTGIHKIVSQLQKVFSWN